MGTLYDREARTGADASTESSGTPGRRTLIEGRYPIQRKAAATAATAAPPSSPSPAGAMPESLQAKMEAAFDFDFSAVRVHQDGAADALGARAFARGNDVHFAPGEYAPDTHAGQALIGHELAHVVQQSSGRAAPTAQGKGAPLCDDLGLEAEADRAGEAAARGERVDLGGGRGGGGGGAVVQRARKNGSAHTPNVTAYPTLEGGQPGPHDIPFDHECEAIIRDRIFPALLELDQQGMKENKQGYSTGYMIGVARGEDGRLYAATSGSVPEEALRVIGQFVHRVIRLNVPLREANAFVANSNDAVPNDELNGRMQVSNQNETGGAAGFCAAFKILYSETQTKIIGMAELLYAPNDSPQPKIVSSDGQVVTYQHGDAVASCATCRVAIHGLLERGHRHRKPAAASSSSRHIPTEQEIHARNVHDLQKFAARAAGMIPGLDDLNLSVPQEKVIGSSLGEIKKDLRAPLARIAELIMDDADVIADDQEALVVLRNLDDAYLAAIQLFSMSMNQATKGTGKEDVLRRYQSALTQFADAVTDLQRYIQSLVDDEGSNVVEASSSSSTTMASIFTGRQGLDLLRERANAAPPVGLTSITDIAPANSNSNDVVLIYGVVNGIDDIWEYNLTTGAMTPLE